MTARELYLTDWRFGEGDLVMPEGRFLPGFYFASIGRDGNQEPTLTCCVHCAGDCERCGSTDRRDVRHTTIEGRGVVARLRER